MSTTATSSPVQTESTILDGLASLLPEGGFDTAVFLTWQALQPGTTRDEALRCARWSQPDAKIDIDMLAKAIIFGAVGIRQMFDAEAGFVDDVAAQLEPRHRAYLLNVYLGLMASGEHSHVSARRVIYDRQCDGTLWDDF